jgi:prophage regulatory protein
MPATAAKSRQTKSQPQAQADKLITVAQQALTAKLEPQAQTKPKGKRRAESLWNIRTVVDKTTRSKSAIYDMVQAGKFPRPILTGRRSVAWVDVEVLDWINQQAENAERGGAGRVAVRNTPWSKRVPAANQRPKPMASPADQSAA